MAGKKDRSATVFVIADDAGVRADLERAIRDRGFGVVPLSSGLGAIAGARQGVVPCAIVFVLSPEDDCVDFVRLQRGDPTLRAKPTILVSLGGDRQGVSSEAIAVMTHFVEVHCR